MKLNEKIKNLRKENKMTQEELAKKLGINKVRISEWENMKSTPNDEELSSLAAIFNVSKEDLTGKKKNTVKKEEKVVKEIVEAKKDVSLNEKDSKTLKGLCKASWIIAKIIKVFIIIAAVCLAIVMVMIPVVFKKIEISPDTIKINTRRNEVVLREHDHHFNILYDGEEVFDTILDGDNDKEIFRGIVEHYGKKNIILSMEVLFVLTIVIIALIYNTLHLAEKFFKNIYYNRTPFTLDNSKILSNIAYLVIATIVVNVLSSSLLSYWLFKDFTIGFDFSLIKVVGILALFSLSYIFKYGYNLETSDGHIYHE